jgi:Ca2+-binding EF-hand superfamily protein
MLQRLRNPPAERSYLGSVVRGLLLVGALTANAMARAADAPAPPPGQPGAQCSCGGKEIDLAKMDERAAKEFAAADTNHDGKISLDEFLAFAPQRGPGPDGPGRMGPMGGGWMGPMGGGWMGHGHGPDGGPNADWQKQHEAQMQQFQSDLFKALDTDHNGQISQAEWANAQAVTATLMKKEAFARMDANHDGYLEKNEFPPYVQKLSSLDTNGDGKVSRDEMKAARQAKGAQTSPSTPSN